MEIIDMLRIDLMRLWGRLRRITGRTYRMPSNTCASSRHLLTPTTLRTLGVISRGDLDDHAPLPPGGRDVTPKPVYVLGLNSYGEYLPTHVRIGAYVYALPTQACDYINKNTHT